VEEAKPRMGRGRLRPMYEATKRMGWTAAREAALKTLALAPGCRAFQAGPPRPGTRHATGQSSGSQRWTASLVPDSLLASTGFHGEHRPLVPTAQGKLARQAGEEARVRDGGPWRTVAAHARHRRVACGVMSNNALPLLSGESPGQAFGFRRCGRPRSPSHSTRCQRQP